MLKVTSETYVYNNNNIGFYMEYDIGYRDDIEVFSYDIVVKSSIPKENLRHRISILGRPSCNSTISGNDFGYNIVGFSFNVEG